MCLCNIYIFFFDRRNAVSIIRILGKNKLLNVVLSKDSRHFGYLEWEFFWIETC